MTPTAAFDAACLAALTPFNAPPVNLLQQLEEANDAVLQAQRTGCGKAVLDAQARRARLYTQRESERLQGLGEAGREAERQANESGYAYRVVGEAYTI